MIFQVKWNLPCNWECRVRYIQIELLSDEQDMQKLPAKFSVSNKTE